MSVCVYEREREREVIFQETLYNLNGNSLPLVDWPHSNSNLYRCHLLLSPSTTWFHKILNRIHIISLQIRVLQNHFDVNNMVMSLSKSVS